MVRDPGQRGAPQRWRVGHQLVHQSQLTGLAWAEQLALQDEGLGRHKPEQARHLGDAGGAGDQAQRDFGQAELDLVVVHGDAVVAHQRQFPAASQRSAIEATHHRRAECLERTEILLGLFDLTVDLGGIRGLQPHRALEIGAGKKRALGRRQDDAVDRVLVLDHLSRDRAQVLLPLAAHGVDRRAGFVKSDGGDAVLQIVLDRFHGVLRVVQRWWRFPCRHPHTRLPARNAACAGATRRSACSGSSRRWRPVDGPWRWRRR